MAEFKNLNQKYITQYTYYENDEVNPTDLNWGSYQYVKLKDIVNNFMMMYSGNHSLINNEERYRIIFHAKRAIQELNYDAFKEIKALEMYIDESVRFVLPSDYVNWVRISLYKNGYLRPLTENIQVGSALAYLKDNDNNILFDENGMALSPEYSNLDLDRIKGSKKSIYLNKNNQYDGQEGYYWEGRWFFDYAIGARYGLNTETANSNPTFTIDKKNGVINFDSTMSGEKCILEYVSDGMEGGNDSEISVNKLFEEYIYAYIKYAILGNKLNTQEYIVARAKKEKAALLRNAKIRISNIHPGRLLMNLRGRSKWIK
jgi:hypothetical protein|tara:strand:+ start:509 stop:1456 length:948 start_codon:yes stop_codon:yes gene_type:complete